MQINSRSSQEPRASRALPPRALPSCFMLAATTLGALIAGACASDDALLAPRRGAELAVRLEVSSAQAERGSRVAVAVRAEPRSARPLGALQGLVRYDASRLRYVGQVAEGNSIALVNDQNAARGELRVVATDVEGFGIRPVALVFEVTADGYARGLSYEHEDAGLAGGIVEAVDKVVIAAGTTVATDLAVPANAARMSLTDWAARIAPDDRGAVSGISLRPGEYRANLLYGDANLSGTVTATDALYLSNVAAAFNEIIIGTDSGSAASRDAVVAGNVFPFNTPGLGEPGDIPPGRDASGTRTISANDVLAVRSEAALVAQPIVGELVPGRGPQTTNRVIVNPGYMTTSRTFRRDSIYELNGVVRVDSGATLTIEPGTRIEGNSLVVSALFIHKEGRIIADGTPLEPIVMTCTAVTKSKGCWGGLVISGYAPINFTGAITPPAGACVRGGAVSTACRTSVGEGGAPEYGGSDVADSSGVLRYLRVEYAGFVLSTNNELNGLTLNGVGNRTLIDYVQIHAGLDDGIEMFGGTVNVKHLLLTANSDDGFDFSDGWQGKAQFVIVQQDSLDSDKGIEADNTGTSATYGATPLTTPQLYNFTFIGKANTVSESFRVGASTGNNVEEALHFRRGTRPVLRNAIVFGYRRALDIDDAITCTNLGGVDGLALSNSIFATAVPNDSTGLADADAACGTYTSPNVEQQFIADIANANLIITDSTQSAALVSSAFDVRVPDFRPRSGQAAAGVLPPADPFFEVVSFQGAVAPANTARTNIPWYAGWTRGWQSAALP